MLVSLLRADLDRQLDLNCSGRQRPAYLLLLRLLHPRFLPLVIARLSRAAMLRRVPVLPQLCTYLNIVLFGLEVSPRCEIGPGLFLPHTSGTVIGAWRIGSNVTIFQNVTLGAKAVDMGFDTSLRPEVGDEVIIGAGAKLLGGIRIGDHAVIGANAVVLASVDTGDTVVGVPARSVRQP
jgi:serine O-acetyltransferase